MNSKNTLFNWEAMIYGLDSYNPYAFKNSLHSVPYNFDSSECPWCSTILQKKNEGGAGPAGGEYRVLGNCNFCGWEFTSKTTFSASAHWTQISSSCLVLKDFDKSNPDVTFNINDLKLPLEAVGIYLKKHFSDVYNLSPRRFEELIEDVFKHQGLLTRLTQQSRDGGADIILLENGNKAQAIVEVKKYSKSNIVGLHLVDRLIGSCIRFDVKKAFLVTTSRFSHIAEDAAKIFSNKSEFEIELWDATVLLKNLGCYSDFFSPLHLITPKS